MFNLKKTFRKASKTLIPESEEEKPDFNSKEEMDAHLEKVKSLVPHFDDSEEEDGAPFDTAWL